MNKKVLVIDDDLHKRKNIVDTLNYELDNPNIVTCASSNDGLVALMNNTFDLIILDWNLPINNGELPEDNIGEEFLNMMENLNIDTNVIVCSSQEVKTNHNNVIGTILYNPMQVLSFKDILGRSR